MNPGRDTRHSRRGKYYVIRRRRREGAIIWRALHIAWYNLSRAPRRRARRIY